MGSHDERKIGSRQRAFTHLTPARGARAPPSVRPGRTQAAAHRAVVGPGPRRSRRRWGASGRTRRGVGQRRPPLSEIRGAGRAPGVLDATGEPRGTRQANDRQPALHVRIPSDVPDSRRTASRIGLNPFPQGAARQRQQCQAWIRHRGCTFCDRRASRAGGLQRTSSLGRTPGLNTSSEMLHCNTAYAATLHCRSESQPTFVAPMEGRPS